MMRMIKNLADYLGIKLAAAIYRLYGNDEEMPD